jgi:hypothetical protein
MGRVVGGADAHRIVGLYGRAVNTERGGQLEIETGGGDERAGDRAGDHVRFESDVALGQMLPQQEAGIPEIDVRHPAAFDADPEFGSAGVHDLEHGGVARDGEVE